MAGSCSSPNCLFLSGKAWSKSIYAANAPSSTLNTLPTSSALLAQAVIYPTSITELWLRSILRVMVFGHVSRLGGMVA